MQSTIQKQPKIIRKNKNAFILFVLSHFSLKLRKSKATYRALHCHGERPSCLQEQLRAHTTPARRTTRVAVAAAGATAALQPPTLRLLRLQLAEDELAWLSQLCGR